jgi:hypothetical protein
MLCLALFFSMIATPNINAKFPISTSMAYLRACTLSKGMNAKQVHERMQIERYDYSSGGAVTSGQFGAGTCFEHFISKDGMHAIDLSFHGKISVESSRQVFLISPLESKLVGMTIIPIRK